ncbi:hypothetical protein [Lampropedia aestuarii]|uniref:hypothetical protein n=1 Tax=Lampropedia aestuarii TaxID=2562762 RepID=UPI002469BD0B|nr:hypothetical protein [Lampropedia aestuarii]MDH5857772.1 hypothetical protein [Lampropedia aestuarii]
MAQKLINPTKKVDRKSFSEFLSALPDLEAELTDALNDMVHASTETGKLSELNLKIKMKPQGGTSGQVELDMDVKAKLPQPTRGKTLMFATPDNNLQRENPKQKTLDGLRTPDQEAQAQTMAALRKAPADDTKAPLRAVN